MEATTYASHPLQTGDQIPEVLFESTAPQNSRTSSPNPVILQFKNVVLKVIALKRVEVSLVRPEVFALNPELFVRRFDKVTTTIIEAGVTSQKVRRVLTELFGIFASNPPPVALKITEGGRFIRDEFTPPKYKIFLVNKEKDKIATSNTALEHVIKTTPNAGKITRDKIQRLFDFLTTVDFLSWKESDRMCALKMNLACDFALTSGIPAKEMKYAFYRPKDGLDILGYKKRDAIFHCALMISTYDNKTLAIDPFIADSPLEAHEWLQTVAPDRNIQIQLAPDSQRKVTLNPSTSNVVFLPIRTSIVYDPTSVTIELQTLRSDDRVEEHHALGLSRHIIYFKQNNYTHLSPASLDFLGIE